MRNAALSLVLGLALPAVAQDLAVPMTLQMLPGQPPLPLPERAATPSSAKPPLYNANADARKDIAAALATAGRENRRVLIQWGGEWCGWCHMLHHTFETDEAIAHELLYEYVVVPVDIGHFDKNMDVAQGYSADLKKGGAPYLTVLGADGKVVANQETGALERKPAPDDAVATPGHDTVKVLAFLKSHEATPVRADAALSDAKSKAKASGKTVLVRWGAPWCGWCHRMDEWETRPEVSALLDRDYVRVKIDQDRMPGGKELLAAMGGADKGIPWFAMLDPVSGKALAVSETGGQNIGFPSKAEEVDCFIGMVKKTAKNLKEADIAALRRTLEKAPEEQSAR